MNCFVFSFSFLLDSLFVWFGFTVQSTLSVSYRSGRLLIIPYTHNKTQCPTLAQIVFLDILLTRFHYHYVTRSATSVKSSVNQVIDSSFPISIPSFKVLAHFSSILPPRIYYVRRKKGQNTGTTSPTETRVQLFYSDSTHVCWTNGRTNYPNATLALQLIVILSYLRSTILYYYVWLCNS